MKLINVHEHLQSKHELATMLRGMDELDIERVVLLGSSAFTLTSDYRRGFTYYDENNHEIVGIARAHPDRVEAWTTLNPMDENKLEKLRTYHELGATGVKLYLGHGFVAPGGSSYLFSPVAIDDEGMYEIYEYCVAHLLPVCLHVNPNGQKPGFIDEFIALLTRYPQMRVNAPHWILSTRRPERLCELLDVFPNLVTDISFGVDEFLIAGLRRISRNAKRLREVIERFPDRFLFGTDFVMTSAPHKTPEWMRIRAKAYLSMLACERYETTLLPTETLNGLALPMAILERIASMNFRKFREPHRPAVAFARPVDWSRMGVPLLSREPGQRLSFRVFGTSGDSLVPD